MRVSSSGYYYWLAHPKGKRLAERGIIEKKIMESYLGSRKIYGSPRIAGELRSGGIRISRPRVARLMNKMGIKSIVRKKHRITTTDSGHAFAVNENILARNFSATAIGQKWVSDITYIPTGEGWLYLTAIMDLADRKIIGWSMSDTLAAEDTVVPAFNMALARRQMERALIFHSDRGVQYACNRFRQLIARHPIRQSMSRKGNCWDNAPMESFFKSMKTEMVYHQHFVTANQARTAIFDYIECWYNRRRKHSRLGYLSPEEFGKNLIKSIA